jgi:ribonuclease E
MPKIMLINVTHSEESRVGILSDNVLEAFEIESLSREHLKGNIYKGVVHRIHPALEAAFVDIGAGRDAFLPLDEICFRNMPSGAPKNDAPENGRKRRRIRDVLRPGEEILVQITKEQFANKPPTLTTFYSLPGRYLVLLPGSEDTGISRRIEGEERTRLRKLVEQLNPPEGFGVIVRTAAGMDEEAAELERDFTYLQRLWENVRRAGKTKRGPALVYREHDIVLRTIRDFFTADIDEIHIDNEEVYQRAHDFLREVMPGKERVLHLYQGDQPIFSAFDVESQIESIFRRRVQLRSGASIVIDGTEALTAIDVNSGGSVRGSNPEETAFKTNLEAATEITRQLRLRDIGGLIVVDFIDMRENRHVQEIERVVREAMKPDKARHEVGRISRFGLMEISRQRLRPAAMATTYTACPMCEGHGAVRTVESAALVALRKIHNRVAHGDVGQLIVSLPNTVSMYLLNQKRDELARLEQRYNTRIQIQMDNALMPHEIGLDVRQRPAVAAPKTKVQPGEVAEADAPAAAAENGAAANGSGKKKRRRRGRRRGGGAMRASMAIADAFSALGRILGFTPPEGHSAEPATTDIADELDADEEMDASEASTAETAPQSDGAPIGAAPAERTGPSRGRRRRRRRGGRSSRQPQAARQPEAASSPHTGEATQPEPMRREPQRSVRPEADAQVQSDATERAAAAESSPASSSEAPPADRPRRPSRRGGTRKRKAGAEAPADPVVREPQAAGLEGPAKAKPARSRKKAAPSTGTKRAPRSTTPRARKPRAAKNASGAKTSEAAE